MAEKKNAPAKKKDDAPKAGRPRELVKLTVNDVPIDVQDFLTSLEHVSGCSSEDLVLRMLHYMKRHSHGIGGLRGTVNTINAAAGIV
jgi:hypothetical protein